MSVQYVTVDQFKEAMDELSNKLDVLDSRLYRDNGGLSIQTRLDRYGRVISVLLWLLGVITTAVVFALVYSIFRGAG